MFVPMSSNLGDLWSNIDENGTGKRWRKPSDLAQRDGQGFKMRPLFSAGTKGAECGKIRIITKNILRHPNLMCLHGEVEWQKGPKTQT
jgi:hypothetical protein